MNATTTSTTTITTRSPARIRSGRNNAAAAAAEAVAAAATLQLALSPLTHGSGALFNIEPQRIEEMRQKLVAGGADPQELPRLPVMSGTIQDGAGVAIPVSVFREVAQESGEVYASLALGGKDRTHYYGKLFRAKDDNGPHYSGFIVVLPVNKGEEHAEAQWAAAPRLQVCGWRRRSANGNARISLSIAPRVVAENELSF